MDVITISTKLWFTIGIGFTLSVMINAGMLLRYIFNKFPEIFYEEDDEDIEELSIQ